MVIGLLLYLNPNETSVFDGKATEFSGITGADVADSGNLVTGASHGTDTTLCDQVAECLDQNKCRDAPFCRNKACNAIDPTLRWVWSYFPWEPTSQPPNYLNQECCKPGQCAYSHRCYDYDKVEFLLDFISRGRVICGSVSNLDYCGSLDDGYANKHPGDLSDGGKYQCVQEDGAGGVEAIEGINYGKNIQT